MSMFGLGGGGAGPPRFATVAEAAQSQSVDAVLEMLNSGHSVNAQDVDGNTALHWAAWFKLGALVSTLSDRGARPDIGNSSGETPVHWAAKSSNVVALETMTKMDRGQLSQRDCDGFTPFIISGQNDNAPVMEWMYLKGISVEEQDDWGRTALQWACYKGHRRTVQWLLSRSASIAHRDHEGMTAIHWAALKGHDQVAEMLLDVGAVHLLDVPDAASDTPIALAMRKKNRYLVMCFHKCQLFQMIFGRPHISRNHFANLFFLFISCNVLVFAFALAPGVAERHLGVVLSWSFAMAMTLVLWVQSCTSDPGCLRPQTITPQHRMIGLDPTSAFDAEQPVESQMAHYDNLTEIILGDAEADGNAGERLARLELEQNKFNYQRQLLKEAHRRLNEAIGGSDEHSRDFQPLMGGQGAASDPGGRPQTMQQEQLHRAENELRARERATGEGVGRARLEALLDQGCGEYLSLLEKGDFKQVCVVCRARREMRSHHCKECGRCVSRLDHHCPWIDNCVGLGNQRSFYCFIVTLFATILGLYYVVALYILDVVLPEWTTGQILTDTLHGFSLGPGPFLTAALSICAMLMILSNVIWLAFVGALVARHTAYMATNLTTYEVLVRPAHVSRRFPKNRGRFWFLHGFGPWLAFRNCANYWTQNTEDDAADFIGAVPQDSFVAPGDGQGSGKFSGRRQSPAPGRAGGVQSSAPHGWSGAQQ